ncbi:MAG: nucleotidyltransferase substrate binding protein [Deltaproteobacteria bacterium]|nr:nucleotidyltransferase substrate binding protein [Deltaproteobacteria bacterium]
MSKMHKYEVEYSLEQLGNTFERFRSAVGEAADGDELKQDGVIQRFEFTFELLWKTVKLFLAYLGKAIGTPREALKEAFRQGFFADEQTYLEMLEDRNLCSHAYDFATARRIFTKIQERYLSAMEGLIAVLREKAGKI